MNCLFPLKKKSLEFFFISVYWDNIREGIFSFGRGRLKKKKIFHFEGNFSGCWRFCPKENFDFWGGPNIFI